MDIFESNFSSNKLVKYYQSMLKSHESLKKIDNRGDTNRVASQALYIALRLRYISQNSGIIPPYTLKQLVDETILDNSEKDHIERVI